MSVKVMSAEDEMMQQAYAVAEATATAFRKGLRAQAVVAAAQVVDNPIAVIPAAEAILLWINQED